jgi:prolyl oligopeptidase
MFKQLLALPRSPVEAVSEILHGLLVMDPYRWLEDQESIRTRDWIEEQSQYARAYLDSIPGRNLISERVRDFLAVETYDSVRVAAGRYFFRKRLPDQQQPCIYMREGVEGVDQLLIDPSKRHTGDHTSVKPLCASGDGRFLLYEVKHGGERTGTFELLDITNRNILTDSLPRGYLRGFVFSPDGRGFYYVHEINASDRRRNRAAYYHSFGTPHEEDREVFCAEEGGSIRVGLFADDTLLGILVYQFGETPHTSIYLRPFGSELAPVPLITEATSSLGPVLHKGRILAITNLNAPNLRIVEIHPQDNAAPSFTDIVPAGDLCIRRWIIANEHLFVSYSHGPNSVVNIYDLDGTRLANMPVVEGETVRLICAGADPSEVVFEAESFTQPPGIYRYVPATGDRTLFAKRKSPFEAEKFGSTQVWFTSRDGKRIPMSLFGREDVLKNGCHPTIMTAYGGYGVPVTPQFSVFVAFLVERGCLFALPNIRGGAEFGTEWHTAAKRRNRQTAYDDFLAAAEMLVETKRTDPDKFAIFGGSNSGLLVGAALTQRPDLFRAVVCMVPLLDMIRYHLFDGAQLWKEEFGVADEAEDFAALIEYSPYHRVRDGVAYPATMFVSGDADRNCNPLHARKMTARLQASNSSSSPIILDYSKFRGHSPVLPLNERIDALTDRMAFLCDQLQLSV